MTKLSRIALAIWFCTSIAMGAPVAGTATLDLEEYLTLKKQGDVAPLTSIEELQITGAFQKSLSLKIAGTSMGATKAENFLAANSDLVLSNCTGNAILQRASGSYAVVPFPSFKEAKRFTLNCQLRVKNWNEIRLNITNVIHAEADVTGMDALHLSENADAVDIVLQPMARLSTRQKADVSAVGRYTVSVRPEESRFIYQITLHNPNAARTTWDLNLANGEVVQKVIFSGEYDEVSASHYSFKVNPGEAQVTLSGALKSPQFTPPLKGQQFLLLENHPLLQLKIDSKSRRVSPADTGLQPSFTGARGYVLQAGESISWEARKLEVFSALGFSVSSARYLYYVPEMGRPVIEADLKIFNQGTPEIPLKIPGHATYVEVNSEPQVLSKDSEGNLLLQLNSGNNRVVFQYQPEREISGGLANVGEVLARPESVLSNVSLVLATPAKWRLGAVKGFNEVESDLGPDVALIFLLTIAAFFYLVHKAFHFSRKQSFGLSGVFALALLFNEGVNLWAWLCFAIILIIKFLPWIKARFVKMPLRTLAIGGVVVLFLAIGLNSLIEKASRFSTQVVSKVDAPAYDSFGAREMEEGGGGGNAMPRGKAAAPTGAARGRSDGAVMLGAVPPVENKSDDYQGLPAKIEIPSAGKKTTFHMGLLDEKSGLRIRGFLYSRTFSVWMTLLLCAFLFWKLFARREQMRNWLRLGN